ncbi:MAG: adenylate cyclase [Proteobacteria bacterium]|nr:adenylate cyclase [Pseudomonadota bacterium]
MAQEIELKLAFPPAARAAIRQHPLLAGAERVGRAQTLINTYYDTPDMALSAQRVALRTRKAGRLWLQTVKCAAESVGGLSSRPEWEQAFHGHFDFSAVDAEQPRHLLEKHAAQIVPLFTTNFRRETLSLSPRDGVRILIMIDTGEIVANGRSEPISELELELETGSADDLLALACELAASLPLLPYDPSKAARGYRLFRNEALCPVRASAPVLDPHTPALQAFHGLAWQTLACWTANLHGVLHTDDPEFIHQLRLALRRLRSLIRIFAPVLPADFVRDWPPVLARQAAELACVRDLTVLRDELLGSAREGDSDQRLPALLARTEAEAAAARVGIMVHLAAPGSGLPLLNLSRALRNLPQVANPPTLPELIRQTRQTLLKQTRQRFRHARETRTPDALHALRIAIKRLRHVEETFAALVPGKAHQRTRSALGKVLTDLGRLNDLAIALPRLNAWAAEDRSLAEAVAFFSGWHAATSLKLRRRILPRCVRLLDKKVWRL